MKKSLKSLIQTNTFLLGGVSAVLFIAALIGGISGGSVLTIIVSILGIIFSIGFCAFSVNAYKSKLFAAMEDIISSAEKIKSGDNSFSLKADTGYDIDYVSDAMNLIGQSNSFVTGIISDIANGDFTRDISGLPDNNAMTSGLKELYFNMAKAFSDISSGAEKVNLDGTRVSTASQSLSQGVSAQANTVDQLSATANELRNAVIKNAENARKAQKDAEDASEAVTNGTEKMNELLKAMDDISNSTNQIANLNKVIEDIAFQTNILALNASVEAARAGDAGKGFAVVASEVKNLAVKSQEASHQTSTVVMSCVDSVKDGVKKTQETASAFSFIAEKAAEIGKGLATISQECEQQTESITQINIGVDQISGVIQNTSATADECAASAAELTNRSGDLREIVERFKFGDFKYNKSSAINSRNKTTAVGKSSSLSAGTANAGVTSKPVSKSAPKPSAKNNSPEAAKSSSSGYVPTPKPAPKSSVLASKSSVPASKSSVPASKSAPVSKTAPKPAAKAATASSAASSSSFKPSKSAVITQPSGSYANAEFIDIPDNKY